MTFWIIFMLIQLNWICFLWYYNYNTNTNTISFTISTTTANTSINLYHLKSGVICCPMRGGRADKLNLPLMWSDNKDTFATAYTVSCDFNRGTHCISTTHTPFSSLILYTIEWVFILILVRLNNNKILTISTLSSDIQ